jgi:hypothetical protein
VSKLISEERHSTHSNIHTELGDLGRSKLEAPVIHVLLENLVITTLVLPRIMNCVIVGDKIAVGIGLLEI